MTVVVLLVLAAGGIAVSCSGFDDDSSSGDADTAGEATGPDGAADSGSAGAAAAPAVVSPDAVEQDAAAGRKRTFTADVSLGVDEVDRAVERAAAAVSEIGGFTATEDVDLEGDGRASVTYRVPADRFDAALDALGALGEVRTKDVQSDDVTAQYADLDSRVAALRTSVDRLHGFLAQTTDVNQIATIEAELTRREAELESTEGQRRALADQVELSTITVAFESLDRAADELPTFLGGLDTGRDVAASLLAAAVATAGFLVPFLPVLALAVAAIVLARRRRRPLTPAGQPPV
ncbi:DUF4349 domain-containing protein [Dermatobacter hominis]|uniref:DUF4349 domain-containing protein n=1 Tax=Dermatobacter hominis TaxID=2884263 RepID=UPI001D10BC0D|nr:DUF4349 domain-containing protein [Dermatobacter hominis]UDY35851.1 DUF4349 domain-containing protein [Dermatobacter hominis]